MSRPAIGYCEACGTNYIRIPQNGKCQHCGGVVRLNGYTAPATQKIPCVCPECKHEFIREVAP